MNKIKEYIWHCPSGECHEKGTILFKTAIPFLNKVKIKCPKCGEECTDIEITDKNKQNLRRYIDSV